jgi:SAM-dependent methyltransferase
MPNPLLAFVGKHAGADFVPRLKERASGFIKDFWKDPAVTYPVFEFKLAGRTLKIPNWPKPMPSGEPAPAAASAHASAPATNVQRWHAAPGEVAEALWGEGQMLPAGDAVADLLITPLGITKATHMLDLTAGLGGPMRRIAPQVSELKEIEADAAIVARARGLSAKAGKARAAAISGYDPANFSMPAIYDCVIARELFYRVADKGKLFYSIAACLKPKGQIAFTDYVVDPEVRDKPAIAAWRAHEKGAAPFGLIEMAEAWAKAGFDMRASEDQTAFYKREVIAGLNRLIKFLNQSPPPDAETKSAILGEVETWIRRLAAIEQGMKFCRFHAIKS